MLDKGIERVAKNGQYVLSYARKWEPVGNDPEAAVKAMHRRRGELLTIATGGTVGLVTAAIILTLHDLANSFPQVRFAQIVSASPGR